MNSFQVNWRQSPGKTSYLATQYQPKLSADRPYVPINLNNTRIPEGEQVLSEELT